MKLSKERTKMTRLRFFLQQRHYAFAAVVLQSFRFALNVPECDLWVELEMGVMSASQQNDIRWHLCLPGPYLEGVVQSTRQAWLRFASGFGGRESLVLNSNRMLRHSSIVTK